MSGRKPKTSKTRHKSGILDQILNNEKSRESILNHLEAGSTATDNLCTDLTSLAKITGAIHRTTLQRFFDKVESLHVKKGLPYQECINIVQVERVRYLGENKQYIL